MMSRLIQLSRSIALLATSVPLAAMAQPQEGITITFAAARVSSVPVGGWASGLLALLLVGLTAYLWKHKSAARTLRALTLVAAAGLAAVSALETRDAWAAPGDYELMTSPHFTPLNYESATNRYTFINSTGGRIRLLSVSENSSSFIIDSGLTTCTVGRELTSGQTCDVVLVDIRT